MRRDDVLVRIKPDGTEKVMPVTPLAPMMPEEVEAAAAARSPMRGPLRQKSWRRCDECCAPRRCAVRSASPRKNFPGAITSRSARCVIGSKAVQNPTSRRAPISP
jgi:hypothetical protein